MSGITEDLDDVRYQHHLKHRGQANHRIFWAVWTAIAIIILVIGVRRASSWWRRRRNRKPHSSAGGRSTKVDRIVQVIATSKVISSLPLPIQRLVIAPPATSSRFFTLVAYIAICSLLLTVVDAPFLSQHYLDDFAVRAAWVTLTQIPLVYLLSAKRGPINLLAGISHERVNWVHRWIGRMLLLSATLHAAVMKASISTSDIVYSNDQSMSVVRNGIGAYSTLVWIAITSIVPLRRWSYRIFFINHWISTLGFPIIVFQHVPDYARTPIYLTIGFVAMDKCLVTYQFIRNNKSVRPMRHRFGRLRRSAGRSMLVAGYPVEMTAPAASILGLPAQSKHATTIIQVTNIPFSWRPGQHMRLCMPALGALEMHPFTPGNCSVMPPPPLPPRKDIEQHGKIASKQPVQTSKMLLLIHAHTGLTRRLADYHAEWLTRPCPNASESSPPAIAYIDGPYGHPPRWEDYEDLILIASSTGVSFSLSILDHLEQLCITRCRTLATQRVRFLWTTRHTDPHLEHTVDSLLARSTTMLRASGIVLTAEIHMTCPRAAVGAESSPYDQFAHLRRRRSAWRSPSRPPLRIRNPDEIYEEWNREAEVEAQRWDQDDVFVEEKESTRYSFESDGASEHSTLVDEGRVGEDDSDPFGDAYATEGEDDAYRPLLPPAGEVRDTPQIEPGARELECQCAIIQHQRRKLCAASRDSDFIVRTYGARPDMALMVRGAVPQESTGKTMVAVCAHAKVTQQVESAVSKIKCEAALGKSKHAVDIFVEGFS